MSVWSSKFGSLEQASHYMHFVCCCNKIYASHHLVRFRKVRVYIVVHSIFSVLFHLHYRQSKPETIVLLHFLLYNVDTMFEFSATTAVNSEQLEPGADDKRQIQ